MDSLQFYLEANVDKRLKKNSCSHVFQLSVNSCWGACSSAGCRLIPLPKVLSHCGPEFHRPQGKTQAQSSAWWDIVLGQIRSGYRSPSLALPKPHICLSTPHLSPCIMPRCLPALNPQHLITPVWSITCFTKESKFASEKLQFPVAVNMQTPFSLKLNFGKWTVNVLISTSGPDVRGPLSHFQNTVISIAKYC